MGERSARVGVIGLPGSWSTEALAASVARSMGACAVLDPRELVFDSRLGTVRCGDADLGRFEALLIKKMGVSYGTHMLDRLELLEHVRRKGVAMFSAPDRILCLLNRLSCTTRLAANGIPMPATVVTENLDEAVAAVRGFGRAIYKPLYSTKARGMALLEGSDPGLRARLESFQEVADRMLYLQKAIRLPGRDLGLVFVGGQYVAAYARVAAEGAWNTTTQDGGHYVAHQPREETIEVATRAQALFGLDFTSVDVVETDEGPMVFEVSAFGGFRGLKEGCGLDAAELFAGLVCRRLAGACG